jgi:hypothetical protein
MSIAKLEKRLDRLNTVIRERQRELSGLKEQRKMLKSQLEEAKRTIKRNSLSAGTPHRMPPTTETHWMATVAARLHTALIYPVARLIGVRSDWW